MELSTIVRFLSCMLCACFVVVDNKFSKSMSGELKSPHKAMFLQFPSLVTFSDFFYSPQPSLLPCGLKQHPICSVCPF